MPRKNSQSIVIVGAGPVGLCCALAVAQDGYQVSVIDSGARGAGWASGGMLGAVYETLDRENVSPLLTKMAFESLSLWQDLAARLTIETLSESIFLGRTPEEAQFLSALASNPQAAMTPFDVPTGLVGMAAWRCARDLALNPRTTLQKLHKACVGAGVTFVTGTVTSCRPHQVTLHDSSVHEGDIIILATGQNGDELSESVSELANIMPVKGQLLAVAVTPSPSFQVVRAGRLYLLARGQQIVIGATSDPDNHDASTLDIDAHAALYNEAIVLCPALKNAPILESWAGLRPMTPDGLPMVGHSSVKGVLLACGTYRNGWLLAPSIAQSIVSLIKGEGGSVSKLQPFSPTRFPI